MKIQKILYPEVGRCMEQEMYFHFGGKIDTSPTRPWIIEGTQAYKQTEQRNMERVELDEVQKVITFEKHGKIWFDTYFNGFSIQKWMKYTVLSEVSLKLTLSGKFRVTLYGKEAIHDEVNESVFSRTIVETKEPKEFEFSYKNGNGKGMYTFWLEALEDGSRFFGGEYVGNIPKEQVRDVKIGIGICTFKREAFIEKNLRILREAVLENEDSPLYGHLEVFVADNGKTLEAEKLQGNQIHIYPNRNLGGAGGFTRDLMEMRAGNDTWKITHALLMDDDIVIEPEALVKTYTILSILKDEYADAFVGGSMLRLDKQYLQVESGASWNGGQLNSLKRNLDLREAVNCLFNEVEEYTEFNAWWYCCFPLGVVRDDNLPMPIFIRGDDLEYGLRNMKHLILMNGICVWHEPFENKYSSFLEYYIIRNQLIDNAFHCPWYGAKQLKREAWTRCKQEIMFYRYKNVDLYLQGVKDFLKGPGWLMEQDGEELHKQIMAAGYKAQDVEKLPMAFDYEEYEQSRKTEDTVNARIKRILTFNGLFLRARGENIVPVSMVKSIMFYRRKRVMHYDVTSHKGFITERNVGTSLRYMFRTVLFLNTVSGKLKKAQNAYRTEGLKLRTEAFWNRYLGLK